MNSAIMRSAISGSSEFTGKVVPVLEKLRTASGVTLSNTHAVFYHITESSNSSDNLTNSNPGWNYKFRLHLTRLGQPQLVSLYQISIVDQSPKPKLSWKNEFELIHRKKMVLRKFTIFRKSLPRCSEDH